MLCKGPGKVLVMVDLKVSGECGSCKVAVGQNTVLGKVAVARNGPTTCTHRVACKRKCVAPPPEGQSP